MYRPCMNPCHTAKYFPRLARDINKQFVSKTIESIAYL